MPVSPYLGRVPVPGIAAPNPAAFQTPSTQAPMTQCPPPCPACGGLECLCRPRFFPGQVLTDDDLNRLENYVVAKNRLHNRYFHGPGVVCGLEVVCDPCNSGNVTVTPGYALSPCGDDIIVCNSASVYICDLINKCRPRQDNCDPYSFQQPVACTQGLQRWVLSICYTENPSRGVQPLMSQPCSCGCKGGCGGSCGGGSSCGCGGGQSTGSSGSCGCGSKSAGGTKTITSSMSPGAGTYNPQCEPTLICEGFSFTATRYIDPKTTRNSDLTRYGTWATLATKAEQFGPLLSRLLACYLKAIEIRDAYANPQLTDQLNETQTQLTYSEFAAALRDFAAEHVAHRCDLARKLACVDMSTSAPDTTNERKILSGAALWHQRFQQLNTIWLELFRECFCSALLPPCPDVTGGNCVPLAVVTIDTATCNVIEICNWTAREFALTLPSLYYWTSFIQWGAIKDVVAKLCCDQASTRTWTVLLDLFAEIVKNNAQAAASPQAAPAELEAARTTTGKNATTNNGSALTGTASQTLLALGGFLGQATMPDGMARLLGVAQPSATSAAGDLADLKTQVAELQKTVADQSAQLAKLNKSK